MVYYKERYDVLAWRADRTEGLKTVGKIELSKLLID